MQNVTVFQAIHRQNDLRIGKRCSNVFFLQKNLVFQIKAGAILNQEIGKLVVIRSGNGNGIHEGTKLLIGSGADTRDLRFLGIVIHRSRNRIGKDTDIARTVSHGYLIEVDDACFHSSIVEADRRQIRTYGFIFTVKGKGAVNTIGIDVSFFTHSPENADIAVLAVSRYVFGSGGSGLIHDVF